MIVEAIVRPNSRKFGVEWADGKLRVSLTEPPEKNKANIELLKELSRLFDCEVRLAGGTKSKKKRLKIAIEENEMKRKIVAAAF